jgi:hypothetical protein
VKRLVVSAQLLSISLLWIFGSQVWASATITDQARSIQVTGLEAYPQLLVGLVVWLLIAFVSRYVKSLFGKFLLTAVTVLLIATMSPVWFESASGSLSVLSPSVAKLTGVSDWASQSQLLSNGFYNHFAADLFVITLIVCFSATVIRIWKNTSPDGSKPLTRIDQLPKW